MYDDTKFESQQKIRKQKKYPKNGIIKLLILEITNSQQGGYCFGVCSIRFIDSIVCHDSYFVGMFCNLQC